MPNINNNIQLSQMIETLRSELENSIELSKGKELRFSIESIELELKVVVTNDTIGKVGAKFWVVNAEGEHQFSKENIHTFKLVLKPKDNNNHDILVANKITKLPER
ncbi:MAG: trypco2 family protein [Mariniphaga sp.]